MDNMGRHGLSCRNSAGRLSRHSTVNDLIKRALVSAEIPSRLKPKSLSQHDDSRPDDLSLIPWSNRKCLAWDFTCPDTLASSHLVHLNSARRNGNSWWVGRGGVSLHAGTQSADRNSDGIATCNGISSAPAERCHSTRKR